ncbi:acetoin utilization protein AcuB [Bacillus tianshenii]|uniref:Acetoin utilization protein AcuB n=1 Tax=Sutcliffiella tianshenii TaxID=1463404 RepID=A0ABS2P411_9BACI|nr:acetoin utilization AcuB family protein [Bacillus tianshenii]MBM7621343.1 acetoin utilization protein AcuB [Bacillus tianshenii]MCA1319899.1 acetoin utilization AcuB family protein [Bacillus tianshenii]
MIVERIMKKDVFTLLPSDTVEQALQLMEKKSIRHIPIVNEKQQLVGIISDRDVRDVLHSSLFENAGKEDLNQPLSKVMKTNLLTGHPLDFVEEVAALFYEYKISCLPIVKDSKLVGILTESDLLYTFIQLTGSNQPASQFEVKVENISGKLSELTSILKERKLNILSVLVYPHEDEQYKIIVLRVQTMNPTGVIKDLQKEGYEVLWPNLPGVTS